MATPLTPDDPAELGGHRLAGRLGEGGQGVVYLAHTEAGEPVAIKLLSTGDRETRTRLARELEALESIASFCTARVLSASTGGPRPYVVSEFIDGPSLAERVRDRGPLAGGDLERVVVGTATALAAIHAAGIVHRDFKPANVLLGPDGPRVVDFGIARAEGAATMTSGLIGTPAYLAPEQIGGTPASPASDVFAWAATVLFAATGVSPFGADTVPAVLHRVLHTSPDLTPLPPRLRGPIGAALAKDPSLRPSAQTLMVQLVNPNTPGQGGPTGQGRDARTGPAPGGDLRQGNGPGTPATGPGAGTGPGPSTGQDVYATGPGLGIHATGPSQRAGHDPGLGGGPNPGPGASTASGGGPGARPGAGGGPGAGGLGWEAGPSGTGPGVPALTAGTGGRRSRALLAGVVAVVFALTAGGAVLVWLNRVPLFGALGTTATPTAPTTAPATSPPPTDADVSEEPTPSPSPSARGNLRIPAAFAGTWAGTADSEMLDRKFEDEAVTITLEKGENTGTWHSPGEDPACETGELRLTDASESELTFRLGGLGGFCTVFDSAGGIQVTLKRTDDDRADYRMTMPLGGKSEGELKRAG